MVPGQLQIDIINVEIAAGDPVGILFFIENLPLDEPLRVRLLECEFRANNYGCNGNR